MSLTEVHETSIIESKEGDTLASFATGGSVEKHHVEQRMGICRPSGQPSGNRAAFLFFRNKKVHPEAVWKGRVQDDF